MKMLTKKFVYHILGVSLIVLTSCTLSKTVATDTDRLLDQIQNSMNDPHPPATQYRMDTIAIKDDIWLGNQSVRVNEGDPLPARFETDQGITLVSTRPVSLLQISEQITSLTGITVRIDDLIIEEVRGATQGEMAGSESGTAANAAELFMPAFSGKLSGLLDQIASRFALWWRYKNGVITFYKMETRVFTIYALPVTSSLNANIAGTSAGEAGGNTSATMDSRVEVDLWSQIEEAITSMLPKDASMSTGRANGTITVTAPPFTLQRISQYIRSLNEKLARQVAVSVKVLQVTLSNEESYGLDLNIVFDAMSRKGLGGSLVPESAITDAAAGMHMGIINAESGGWSKFNGSKLLIEALATQGSTSLVTSTTITTLNNKVAPVQVSTNTAYIEKTETTTSGDTVTTTATPGNINAGFTMEVLPRILDHGRLLIMFTMTITDLTDLTTQTFGSGDNQTMIQLPEVETRGFVQEVAMRSGSTLVLTGFEKVDTKTNNTKGVASVKDSANRNRNVLVILLTPEVLISPLSPETRMGNL